MAGSGCHKALRTLIQPVRLVTGKYCCFAKIKKRQVVLALRHGRQRPTARIRDGRPEKTAPRRNQSGYQIPFHLSSSYRHKEHRRDCFVDHLSDAAALYGLRKEINHELQSLRLEQIDLQRAIAYRLGTLDVTASHPELGEFDSELKTFDKDVQDYRHRLGEIFADESAKREQLEIVNGRFQKLMVVVYDTAEPFCTEVVFGEQESELELDNDVCALLQLAKQCDKQVRLAQERLGAFTSQQDSLASGAAVVEHQKREASASILHELILWRESLEKRYDRVMQDEIIPRLGAKANAVHFCTQANMEKLNSQAGPQPPVEVDIDDSSLDLQRDSDNEARTSRTLPWRHDGSFASRETHTSMPNVLTLRLAERIREHTQLVQARKDELYQIRNEYFRGLCAHLFGLPSSSRERWDQILDEEGQGSFAQTSSDALARLQQAQSELYAARRDMRRHINQTWQPSEPSLGDRTSDYNTPSAPAMLVEKAPGEIIPLDIRKWCARVAREADPTERASDPGQHEVVDLVSGKILSKPVRPPTDTAEYDDTPEHWARKQKWMAKAKEIGIRPDEGISGTLRPLDV